MLAFFSFSVSNTEIKKYVPFVLMFGKQVSFDLYSLILIFFALIIYGELRLCISLYTNLPMFIDVTIIDQLFA